MGSLQKPVFQCQEKEDGSVFVLTWTSNPVQ